MGMQHDATTVLNPLRPGVGKRCRRRAVRLEARRWGRCMRSSEENRFVEPEDLDLRIVKPIYISLYIN